MLGVKSPAKNMTIGQLEEIRANHYLSRDGKRDYSECEVEVEYWKKQQRKADKIDPIDFLEFETVRDAPRVIEKVRTVVLPPYPRKPSLMDCIDLILNSERKTYVE